MSVSQPLATDGAHGSTGNAPSGKSRRGEAADSAKSGNTSSDLPEFSIRAPKQLTLETRIEFRSAAATLIDRIPAGAGRLVIDCGPLQLIDSVGLNALIIVRRRAAARRVEVVLRDLEIELRALLVLTKLEDLFELEDGLAR